MSGKSEAIERRKTTSINPAESLHDRASSSPENAPIQRSILGVDTTLTGDLIGRGDITVEGTVNGSIKCRSLTLRGQPTISGSVEADAVHVCGTFNGELRANKVVISKTAKMRGDIFQKIVEVHPGASFEGRIGRLDG